MHLTKYRHCIIISHQTKLVCESRSLKHRPTIRNIYNMMVVALLVGLRVWNWTCVFQSFIFLSTSQIG
ncbi:hypothetical protein BDZ91DRAFT_130167 [Kalaharituber pfeilii]|nr:hypothetical protein BDZ91DRAFT_130167 [Kalaharituber pfeilii]